MTKMFRISVDVTMSGDVYIEADSMEEAKEIANHNKFTPNDLRWFHHYTTEVVDGEEVDE